MTFHDKLVIFSISRPRMATQLPFPVRVAFGPFEVNAAAGELLKSGIRIRLPGQPFQILLVLLANPGNIVTRDELREQVWKEGTFVDFEHGLNAAVNKLRSALGDSADKPRYIETVAGRGYRFIGILERPVEQAAKSLAPEPLPLNGRPDSQVVSGTRRNLLPWVMLSAVSTIFGIWGMVTLLKRKPVSPRPPILEFTVRPPPGTIFAPPISRQPFAISPDGTRLAFTAAGPNNTNIWIRDLAALDLHLVPGTEGAWTVFWPPDSRSLFYSIKRNLLQANLENSSTRSVATLPTTPMVGAWRSTGDLLLYLGHTSYELADGNGTARKIPGASLRWPQFLTRHDALHIVFDPALSRYRAFVTDDSSQRLVPLMETDSRVEYAPPARPGELGSLLYIRGASLLVQPFDADALRLAGEPYSIAQNVIYFRPTGSACFSVSENGVLVYQSGFPASELNWYDRTGHITGTFDRSLPYVGTLRISPDGQNIAAGVWSPESGGFDIWIFDENGRQSRRLTFAPASHFRPVWSPDGKRLAFGGSSTSAPTLMTVEMAEPGRQQRLVGRSSETQDSDQIQIPTDWSGDGRFVAFDTGLGEEEQEVWLADTAQQKSIPLLRNEFGQWGAAFSPDGSRIAFVSAESGRPEVYVQSFTANPSPHVFGERQQISRNGAWLVRWRPDGRELFYVGADNWLNATPVAAAQLGDPKPLFRIAGTSQYGTSSDFQFDVTKDGRRFVMSTTGSVAAPSFTVVENWQDKFRR